MNYDDVPTEELIKSLKRLGELSHLERIENERKDEMRRVGKEPESPTSIKALLNFDSALSSLNKRIVFTDEGGE